MSTAEAAELRDILNRVTTWPTTLQITLARKILESLDKAEAQAATPPPKILGESAAAVQGSPRAIWPPAVDEAVDLTTGVQPGPPLPRKGSLRDLLGILKTGAPPPDDAECRSILEDELIRKHLK